MNIMQFWVIDTFIKHKYEDPNQIIRLNHDEEEQDGETLLTNNEPTDSPPRYSTDEDVYTIPHDPSEFVSSSSSTDTPILHENEYELKSPTIRVNELKSKHH